MRIFGAKSVNNFYSHDISLGMKICLEGFFGSNHSWKHVHDHIALALVKKGHNVHIRSTNGYEHFCENLKPYINLKLDNNYDCQISYTAMKNFPIYLSHGNKNRFGIWNYETTILPVGFSKFYKYTDKFLPSSNFSKEIFAANGVPEEHMTVVPHGVDLDIFKTENKYQLKTKKKFKILVNIAQPHIRKNIPGMLEAFGRAFNNKDDVCLVAKVVVKKPEAGFEVDFTKMLAAFKRKYPNHGEIELVTHFIPNIAELYNSCDSVFSMTHAECFWLPGIESMAANKITIAPRYGGQLDFMNDDNSLLIPGKLIPAPAAMQYWTSSPHAAMFEPNIDEASKLLQMAYKQQEELVKKFTSGMQTAIEVFSWSKVADQIEGLCV